MKFQYKNMILLYKLSVLYNLRCSKIKNIYFIGNIYKLNNKKIKIIFRKNFLHDTLEKMESIFLKYILV